MIRDVDTARKVSDLMIDCSARLDASIHWVIANGTPEEISTYKRAIGRIMGDILFEVMNPIYARHPELKPDGLK